SLPTANLRRRAHFSPSIMMLSAVDAVWFVVSPQTTPLPHTTLKPEESLEPQTAELPQTTDLPHTTLLPHTTELSQTTLLPHTTLVPVTKSTVCVVGSYTAVGDAAEASARSLLDSAAAISR